MIVLLFGTFTNSASANHSWGGYHWARTSNPFTLKLGDNVSTSWDTYLRTASSDWSLSTVLDTIVTAGKKAPRTCKPTLGSVEVCNSKYGTNGWMGLAQAWSNGIHITQATVKVNDSYFSMPAYNTPAWKQSVMCQEIGHTLGLDHQDEDFYNTNLSTCMDYTSDPSTNQHPNLHDYEELELIYAHLDTLNTITATKITNINPYEVDLDNPSEWGKKVHESKDKKVAKFEKDLGNGNKLFSFVIWAE